MWRVTLNCSGSQTPRLPARPPRCSATRQGPARPSQPSTSPLLAAGPGPGRRPNRRAQLAPSPRSEPPETQHHCPSRGTRSGTDVAARLGRPAPSSPPPSPLHSWAPSRHYLGAAPSGRRAASSSFPCARSPRGRRPRLRTRRRRRGASTPSPTTQPSAAASAAVTSPSSIGWGRPRPPPGGQSAPGRAGERAGVPLGAAEALGKRSSRRSEAGSGGASGRPGGGCTPCPGPGSALPFPLRSRSGSRPFASADGSSFRFPRGSAAREQVREAAAAGEGSTVGPRGFPERLAPRAP